LNLYETPPEGNNSLDQALAGAALPVGRSAPHARQQLCRGAEAPARGL